LLKFGDAVAQEVNNRSFQVMPVVNDANANRFIETIQQQDGKGLLPFSGAN